MYKVIKAAAVSLRAKPWDKSHNADKMEKFIRLAARKRPDLVVLPEGVLEGYCVADVVLDPRRADEFATLAEPIDGPYIRRFQELAQRLKLCLCFGFAERVGGEVYNAAIFIDHSGHICGKHHKVDLDEGHHPHWRFNRVGSKLRAFDTPLGRCGILICADRGNSLVARALALDGARLILIPTYGSRSRIQNGFVLARARENGVAVVQANRGMNMMVSKGEMVAYKWGMDQITVAEVEAPVEISPANARAAEKAYFATHDQNLKARYLGYLPGIQQRRRQSGVPPFPY